MSDITTDQSVQAYLDHLEAQGRGESRQDVGFVLTGYIDHLARRGHHVLSATVADVEAFRAHLASPAASLGCRPLAITTQATRLGIIRGFHHWLRRRGLAIANPAKDIPLPRIPNRKVQRDFLRLQEAEALVATAAEGVGRERPGSKAWAVAVRDLAMLALALATGRRSSGLCHLLVEHLDVENRGLRVEREKGFMGRVLPVVDWAVDVVVVYRDQARPIILGGRSSPWLFVGQRDERIAERTWDEIVRRAHRETCEACPDLLDLPQKTISTHGLRMTLAHMLFVSGCPIRVVNELLLHRRLTTTAAYTPLDLHDLRRAVTAAHPRA